jgi:hypothetical protein
MAHRWRLIQRADGVPNRTLGDWMRDPLNRDREFYLDRRRKEVEADGVAKERAGSAAIAGEHITLALAFLARFQPLWNSTWIVSGKSTARLTSVEQASAWLKKSMEV